MTALGLFDALPVDVMPAAVPVCFGCGVPCRIRETHYPFGSVIACGDCDAGQRFLASLTFKRA